MEAARLVLWLREEGAMVRRRTTAVAQVLRPVSSVVALDLHLDTVVRVVLVGHWVDREEPAFQRAADPDSAAPLLRLKRKLLSLRSA
jgi:hypothetical protein